MRLTLRTMLACLDADDRLDPADAEELGNKIEQSKNASDLAQRIRRVVQHPRLSSPRLDGKGMGLDPNSVAEYLDNVLPADRVGEFERMCLASDIQLAEVAACHQVLVLVLEQPAEFDPALRDRVYRIGAESSRRTHEHGPPEHAGRNGTHGKSDHAAEPPVVTTADTAPTPATPKPLPEVPEYLRAGRRRSLWPLALAALLAFVVVGAGLRALGPLDNTHPMAKLLQGANTQIAEVPKQPQDDKQGTGEETLVTPNEEPETPVATDKSDKTEVTPGNTDQGADNKAAVPVNEPPADTGAKQGNETEAMPDIPNVDVTPVVPDVPGLPPEPETDPAPPVKNGVPAVADSGKGKTPGDPPVPIGDVGRLVSEDQVVVRVDRQNAQWSRVPARGSILQDDELVVFPAYRAQVLLANGVQLTLSGETKIKLGMIDGEGIAHVRLDYGRVLASSVGKRTDRLALEMPGMRGVVSFADVDSELAVEVRKYLPPGSDPEMVPTINVARLYCTRGSVSFQEGHVETPGESFAIAAGEVRNYVGEDPGQTMKVAAIPDWVDGKNVSEIDRRAAHDINIKLAADRPLELTLDEMASEMERRAEIRALAIRSLAYLDKFEPFVAAFNDENQRVYWTAEFDVLQNAVARSPETAKKVREAYEKLRGEEEGGIMYRMLWGYSPEELKTTELPIELVKFLDVEALDFRVFAFENLRRITGSTQLYLPHFTASRRRIPVTQWTNRLKAGEIVYKVPPAPINDPRPVGP